MKSAYEFLEKDAELNYILEHINYNLNQLQNFERETSDVNYTICCHGKHHAMFVVGVTEYILSALSYDGHTSSGADIQSAVGAALLIADKMTDKERGIYVKADMIKGGFDEAKLNKSENPHARTRSDTYTVKDFQFSIIGSDLIFDYFVEGDTEVYISEYSTDKRLPVILTKKAADFLECSCIYKVNGNEF